jgi:hypothetical protein
MLKPLVYFSLVSAFVSLSSAQSQTPFSTDSATSYLRTIAVDIGARPMGSPNEHRAMEFALAKFREFGLSETFIMPIREYPGYRSGTPTNTRSGVAVGILRGATSRIIVLGAHIDSASPDVPGANDDGSGSAVVIELARVLSQRKNQSTIVFALFGGEEAGLQGSRYFIEHFPDTSRIVLMLQTDMANGSQLLLPLLDVGNISSPEWLVRASYEESSKLGYTALHFPTDFFVFMGALPGGGVGSDHQPFLERNIPAIDFTSDARDPIHTPQDNFENFKVSGLKRSGDLIYKLVERFDGGVPETKVDKYFLYEVAAYPFFVPMVGLRIFIVLTLIAATVALIAVRRRRETYQGTDRPKIPGLKLFLLMLIIQICIWLSENVVSLIKGVRFPWMADINSYYVLGLFGAGIGIWISLQLSEKLRLRHDPYSYYLRAFVFLVVFVVLCTFLSLKLALYPATALLLLALAMLIRQPILKLLFWLLSPHFMFRLMFSEAFDFLARIGHSQPDITPTINAAVQIGYVLFFSFWAFPFLLGFAAIYYDAHNDLSLLQRFRQKTAGIIVVLLFVATVVFLSSRDSYSKEWQPSIVVEENFNLDSTRGTLVVQSSEYLKNTRLVFCGRDTTLRGSTTEAEFNQSLPLPAQPWIEIERNIKTSRKDSTRSVELLLQLKMKYRPYRLSVTLSTARGKFSNVSAPFAFSSTDRSIALQWAAFPDSSLSIPVSFAVTASDSLSLTERVEATFIELLQPVSVESNRPTSIIRRSTIAKQTVRKLE